MRKKQVIIYFWCAAKDNWASQISEVALRKELEQWKSTAPPSGQKLRISNQIKMLWKCLEEDVCLYRPDERWEGEFEWLKTLQALPLENCRKYLSLGVRKTLKLWNSTYISTCCLGGFQEKLSKLIQKQTPVYSVIRHDWNFKWDWLLLLFSSKRSRFISELR